MWDNVVESQVIREGSQCKRQLKGNVISWEKENFKLFGADILEIEIVSFCEEQTTLVMFPQMYSLTEAKTLCAIHGGKIIVPHSEDENSKIINILSKHKYRCIDEGRETGKALWLGLEYIDPIWYEMDDYSVVGEANYTKWKFFHPNPNTFCSYMKPNGVWSFKKRHTCTGMKLCTMCSIPGTPLFTLKGSIHLLDSYIDVNYYMYINETNQLDFYEAVSYTHLTLPTNREV